MEPTPKKFKTQETEMISSQGAAAATDISCLPPEMLSYIFGMLSVQEKGRCARVSTNWRDVAYIPSLWQDVPFKWDSDAPWDNPTLCGSLKQRMIRKVEVPYAKNADTGLREYFLQCELHSITSVRSVTINYRHIVEKPEFCPRLTFLRWMPELTELILVSNYFMDDDSVKVVTDNLKQLVRFEFRGFTISDISLKHVSLNLKKLTHLSLKNCFYITDVGVSYLTGHSSDVIENRPALQYLKLRPSLSLTNKALELLSVGQTGLRSLILDNNLSIYRPEFKQLLKFDNLVGLVRALRLTQINDEGVDHLLALTHLQVLHVIGFENISEWGLRNVKQMVQIREVFLNRHFYFAGAELTRNGFIVNHYRPK